jgi:hypothetical protein
MPWHARTVSRPARVPKPVSVAPSPAGTGHIVFRSVGGRSLGEDTCPSGDVVVHAWRAGPQRRGALGAGRLDTVG